MTRRHKRITAMRENPKNVRPDELDAVLTQLGYTARQKGTSHRYYSRGELRLSVPQRKPFLLETYVKEALDQIDMLVDENPRRGASDHDDSGDNDP